MFADDGGHVSCQSNVNQNTLDRKTDDGRLSNMRLQTDSSDDCRYGAHVKTALNCRCANATSDKRTRPDLFSLS